MSRVPTFSPQQYHAGSCAISELQWWVIITLPFLISQKSSRVLWRLTCAKVLLPYLGEKKSIVCGWLCFSRFQVESLARKRWMDREKVGHGRFMRPMKVVLVLTYFRFVYFHRKIKLLIKYEMGNIKYRYIEIQLLSLNAISFALFYANANN